jgi:CheY-like chemotaxis protein
VADAARRPRILVVEDEMLVAMAVEGLLEDLGCEIAATCGHLDEALRAAAGEPLDFAILDVNLEGKRSYAVADALRARGVPFVFATGYGREAMDAAYAGQPTLAKPFMPADLERALKQAGVI